MPKIARFMDMVGSGVIQNTKVTSVIVEGRPVATLGDMVSAHGEAPHISAFLTIGCSASVVAEGQPVAMVGTKASCMHSVNRGSFTVNVGL